MPRSDPAVPPFTSFGGRRRRDGKIALSSIDWQSVVLQEPEHVAEWLLYLHRHRCLDVMLEVLDVLSDALKRGHEGCTQWSVYIKYHLHTTLIDIVLELDVFSDPRNGPDVSFLPISYVVSRSLTLTYRASRME